MASTPDTKEMIVEQVERPIEHDGLQQTDMDKRNAQASVANRREHDMTVREAIRNYRWAIIWSLAVSMSVIMEGYDTILIGSLYAYPTYKEQFGIYSETAKGYQIEGKWQAAMGSGPQAGAFIGALANGWLCPRYGYKPVFLGATILMIAFIFPSFFGESVELQALGQILCGIPWGVFATIGPAYASELCPLAVRPYLTAYTNMCFAIGQLIGAGVLKSLLVRVDEWGYRIPFAIQWLWPPFLIVVAILMPESPWYLVRKGRLDQAEASILRIMSPAEHHNSKAVVAMMAHTDEVEREITVGTSYFDCFRGIDLRRTEIACLVFVGQITCGAQFAYSATYFFEQAGLDPDKSYALNLGATGLAFCGTLASWFLMRAFGRRNLYLCGMLAMCTCLLIIGFLTLSNRSGIMWAQAAMCLLWLLSFSLTIGPVGWTIPAEVSSTRLRTQTVVLARNTYYLAQIVANVIQPYMMNPTAWNWKGKTGFFWFGTAALSLVWAFFRMPETKSRTFEELDVMFAQKLPTRKFKKHEIDVYGDNEGHIGATKEV